VPHAFDTDSGGLLFLSAVSWTNSGWGLRHPSGSLSQVPCRSSTYSSYLADVDVAHHYALSPNKLGPEQVALQPACYQRGPERGLFATGGGRPSAIRHQGWSVGCKQRSTIRAREAFPDYRAGSSKRAVRRAQCTKGIRPLAGQ